MGFVIHWHESAMSPTLKIFSLFQSLIHFCTNRFSFMQQLTDNNVNELFHVSMFFFYNSTKMYYGYNLHFKFICALQCSSLLFSSVQLSRVWLFVTSWAAAHQTSLSITNSQSSPKPMSIESVMPSNHLILCHSLLPPSIFPSMRVFSNESALCIRWLRYWSFSFNISPSNEHPGIISLLLVSN